MKNKANTIAVLALIVGTITLVMVLWTTFFKKSYAYVDANKLFADYKESKLVQGQLDQKMKVHELRLDTLNQELKEMMLSKKGQSDIQKYQRQIYEYSQAAQQDAANERAKVMGKVSADIRQKIQEYGKEQGFDIILVSNEAGVLSYARERLDITKDVLALLNR